MSRGAALGAAAALVVGAGGAAAQEGAARDPRSEAEQYAAFMRQWDELTSVEQGTLTMRESFFAESRAERIREQRRKAFDDTKYDVHLRSYYLDRHKFDNSESEAWATGGWAGLKTGYFGERLALGGTGYFSVPTYAPDGKDGTRLLKPGQEGYAVLGELYGDVRITDDVHAHVGRKAYETPYINRFDIRMTPQTFEAYTLSGLHGDAQESPEWRWGLGYFDKIKEIDADQFTPMSEALGASVDRGVYSAGLNFRSGDFSLGAIDYFSDDLINIAYGEAKYAVPFGDDLRLQFAAQYGHQQSTGDELLNGSDFSGYQYGLKGELLYGPALFTAGWTSTGDGFSLQSPWGGYPGYTSVQVENFNRAGEDALILRAAWNFPGVPGLSMYGLWVNGTDPESPSDYAKDEYDFNLQWSAKGGPLAGLTLRFRYALIEQDGGGDPDFTDLRLILYYDPPGL